MDEKIFCQSCDIPLDKAEIIGTNQDGSHQQDYCVYCYQEGSFTTDVSMEEMIEISLQHMKELLKDNPQFNEQEALDNMNAFFPQLKRWQS